MSKESNPRKQLRKAIKANAEALDDMHRAELLLQKAQQLMGSLMEKRSDFDSLDSEIAIARAANLKQALDGDDNTQLLTQPVQGFATKQVARDNLDLQIAGVRDSLPTLQAELDEARGHAAQTDYEVELARERVFISEAQELADDFVQRLLQVRLMSMRLRFMSLKQVRRDPNAHSIAGTGTQFYGAGQLRTISIPREVMDAIGEEVMGSFDRRNPPRIRDDIGRAIQAYWSQLRMDADATLDVDELASACRPSAVGAFQYEADKTL